MQLSNRWHVQLGEGGRRMTDSQVKAAAARCWIDEETPVRKPQSSEWTKLGDVAPAKRIEREEIERAEDAAEDITTSGMILTSGEFELVDDDSSPSREELRAARPKRLAPKLFVLAIAMLAGGAVLARHRIPKLDAELDALVTAMRPAPLPTPSVPAVAVQAPTPITVTSSATLAVVPKMPAPAPKMREPTRVPEPPQKPTKAASTAKPKAKRPALKH